MKLLYLSTSSFFDTDFPLIKHLKVNAEVTSLFFMYPDSLKATMIEIDKHCPKTGIFKAIDVYPEFGAYADCLDLEHTYVLNRVNRNKLSMANIVSYFQLICFILKVKADSIYSTIIFHVIDWPLFLFAKKVNSAFHDPIPHSSSNVEKNKKMYKQMIDCVKSCVIFNSCTKQEFIETFNIPEKNVYISKLGLNDLFLNFTTDKKVNYEYILFWGRIEPYKGIEYLLEAMVEVHKHFPDTKLVIAGRGKVYFDDQPYKNLDYISFDNRFLSVSELANLVKNCKYVVCPYKDATQSGVVTTAFAFDKPVIGTNVGAIPEYVQHEKFGIIVPPCDSKSLAEAIMKLEVDSDYINQLSSNIHRYYSKGEGNWNAIADNLLNHLSK